MIQRSKEKSTLSVLYVMILFLFPVGRQSLTLIIGASIYLALHSTKCWHVLYGNSAEVNQELWGEIQRTASVKLSGRCSETRADLLSSGWAVKSFFFFFSVPQYCMNTSIRYLLLCLLIFEWRLMMSAWKVDGSAVIGQLQCIIVNTNG